MTTFNAETVNAVGSTFTDVGRDQHNNYTFNVVQNAAHQLVAGPSQSSSLPAFNDVPLDLLSVHFTGRDRELERILLILKVIHGNVPTRCGLFGMHGVGKSQVTFELAKEAFAQGLYAHIFWIPATTVEKLYQGFCKLLHLVDHPDRSHPEQSARLTAARRWLEEYDAGRWLLVLDNVERETVEFLREHLPRKNSLGNILFTTRTEAVAKVLTDVAGERHEIVELRIPDVEDASKLLLEHLKDSEIETDTNKLQKVVKCIGCLPLAVAQVAAYVKETGRTLDNMLALFDSEHMIEMINWENELSSYQEKSVAATFDCQLINLEAQSPDASDLMKLLAFFDPESIPLDMLTTGANIISNYGAGRDSETDVPRAFSPKVAALLLLIQSPARLQNAISQLQNRSLTKRHHRTGSSSLWIHDLTQLVVLEHTNKSGSEQEWFECAVELACSAFQQLGHPYYRDSWAQYEALIPHIHSLTRRDKISRIASSSLLKANGNVVRYLYGRGRHAEASTLAQQVLRAAEKLFGLEHPHTLWALQELAYTYRIQGLSGEAEELLDRALQTAENHFGPEHIQTLSAMYDLASIYRIQGRYREAEVLLQRALMGREARFGPEHSETLWAMHDLSNVYRDQGRYKEAEELLDRVLLSREKHFGSDHIETIWVRHNLGRIYREQGRYDAAEVLLERVRQARSKHLGVEHSYTLETMHELACVYAEQGRYPEAVVLLEKVLQGYEKQFGSKHVDTLGTTHDLGHVYRELGRYGDAEALLDRVLQARKKMFGLRHVYTLKTMREVACVYREQGRLGESEALLDRVLLDEEEQFGPEHPSTLTTMNELAGVYERQERYSDAETVLVQVLKGRERLLGLSHPHTRGTMKSLEGVYEKLAMTSSI